MWGGVGRDATLRDVRHDRGRAERCRPVTLTVSAFRTEARTGSIERRGNGTDSGTRGCCSATRSSQTAGRCATSCGLQFLLAIASYASESGSMSDEGVVVNERLCDVRGQGSPFTSAILYSTMACVAGITAFHSRYRRNTPSAWLHATTCEDDSLEKPNLRLHDFLLCTDWKTRICYDRMTSSRASYTTRGSHHALFLQLRNLAVLVTEFPQHFDGMLRQDRRRTSELSAHFEASASSAENNPTQLRSHSPPSADRCTESPAQPV